MDKVKVQILVGLPGAGKTRYAAKRAREDGAVVIDIDAIVTMLHAGQYKAYDKSLDPIYKAIESHTVNACLLSGRDVVFDKCCNKRSTRARIIALARQLDNVECEVVLFEEDDFKELSRRRAESDPRGWDKAYWEQVILKRMDDFEPVDPEVEGFDSVITISKMTDEEKQKPDVEKRKISGLGKLPNGCNLYVEKNNQAGGRTYFSDESGSGVVVWDTALVDHSTLLSAMVQESRIRTNETKAMLLTEEMRMEEAAATGGSFFGKDRKDPGSDD